jgi:sarcosine oxidase, subunit beta
VLPWQYWSSSRTIVKMNQKWAKQMQTDRNVTIIGAGVVGCSIALALARRGFRTLNLDTLPAAGYGSTSHSSAIVRPIYSHITSCAIAHQARRHWLNWADFLQVEDERGMARYTECGGLVLIKQGEESRYDANLTAMQAVGVPYELLSAGDIKTLYPGISLASYGPPVPASHDSFCSPSKGEISSGILVPQAGYVSDPQLATHNLQVAAQKHGAEFIFNARVAAFNISHSEKHRIELDDGRTFFSATVINAAGPHSSKINQLAGITNQLKLSTRAMRHEVAYIPANARHFERGGRFLMDMDAGFYQRPDGKDMLIGSSDPVCDPHDFVDPDNYNLEFTPQWNVQTYRAAQRFPEMGIPNTARGTVGLYDVSDDWIPIYDKTSIPGYYLAIGTSGNQFKNAPLIGEIMAAIINTENEGNDHDKHPACLKLPDVGQNISLDFYSRNRDIQHTSSVMA